MSLHEILITLDDILQLIGSVRRQIVAESLLCILTSALSMSQQRLAIADFRLHLVHEYRVALGMIAGSGVDGILNLHPRLSLTIPMGVDICRCYRIHSLLALTIIQRILKISQTSAHSLQRFLEIVGC